MSGLGATPAGHYPAQVRHPPESPWSALPGALLVAAELLLGWVRQDIANWTHRHHWLFHRDPHLVQWWFIGLPFFVLAGFAALASRTSARAGVAVLAALLAWAVSAGYNELFAFLYRDGHHLSVHAYQILGYAEQMTVAALATVAWGLSRRRGARWLIGPVVAMLGAAATIRTDWPSHTGWAGFPAGAGTESLRQFNLLVTVAVLVPILFGCLVSWGTEHWAVASPRQD